MESLSPVRSVLNSGITQYLVAVFLNLFALGTLAQGTPLPLNSLWETPSTDVMEISPDGSKIALTTKIQGKRFIALLDANQPSAKPQPIGYLEDFTVEAVWWKGNDLMLMLLRAEKTGWQTFQSFDLKTKKINQLPIVNRRTYNVVHPLPDDPENVLISTGELQRLNVRTGNMTIVEKHMDFTWTWYANGQGQALAATGSELEKDFVMWRSSPSEKWQRRELGKSIEPDFIIAGVHPDQRRLIAWVINKNDTASVVALDPSTMEQEFLFKSSDVDADGLLTWPDNQETTGIFYDDGKIKRHFINQQAGALQASIDAALPDTTNVIKSVSADRMRIIILASSDRDPGSYYLLDRQRRKIIFLDSRFAAIDPERMGSSEYLTFQNRSGTTLHARLTLPPNRGTRPPLIIINGSYLFGPRNRARFDLWSQALATRGYAVARIDTRGTYGYGEAFRRAGAYELGKGIPDDLDDGVRALIETGKIDANKVGLLSFYWGGIAGMNTIARSPLFKAWANWQMPLDIKWIDYDDVSVYTRKRDDAITELGGSWAAHNYLKTIDPLKQARAVKVPSFHFYQYYAATRLVDIAILESTLSKNGVPGVFVRGKETNRMEDAREEVRKGAEALLAFFDSKFTPAKP